MGGSGMAEPTVPTLPPGAPAVPPPPRGPGVQPPFVAPPTDGTRRRRGVAVGLSIGAVVALCAVCAAGIVGLGVLLFQVVRDEAEATVVGYLTALRDGEYDEAYDRLCDDLQERTSSTQFEREVTSGPAVVDFEVGGAELTEEIYVPASIRYDDGSQESVRFVMFQDPTTGALEVCGEVD